MWCGHNRVAYIGGLRDGLVLLLHGAHDEARRARVTVRQRLRARIAVLRAADRAYRGSAVVAL